MSALSPSPVDEDHSHDSVSTAFVPCVEDAAYTRQLGRHPAPYQRTLDAVSYQYLVAHSRLAKAPASDGASRSAFAATLKDNYELLWQQRSLVPRAARREWFETVQVYLEAMHALELGLLWLTDQPLPSSSTHSYDQQASEAAPPAAVQQRKLPKRKAEEQQSHPLWYAWQDTQRHLHHLTLRLHTWTPARGGAYAAREALRPADLVRMDSAAFAWRVRTFARVGCAALTGSLAARSEVRQRAAAAAFAAEEPELSRLLITLCSEEEGDSLARNKVAGTLLYRVLLEVVLVRLRSLPRCIFTWRLLRDMLLTCAEALQLSTAAPDGAAAPQHTAAALRAMVGYVEDIIVPYLEQRDCQLGNVRHTASSIHAHFTRCSSEKMRSLYHLASAGADAATTSSASLPSTLQYPESNDRPLEEQRHAMRVAACSALLQLCRHDVVAVPSASECCADILTDEEGSGDTAIDAGAATDTEVLLASLADCQAGLRSRRPDERLFYSEASRRVQLNHFLYHYFTQSPTMAFDRVIRGAAATDASSINGGDEEGKED